MCRQIGVSEATYYTCKKRYGDVGVTELRRLKMLEDKNARLKRIVANLTLDKQILQDFQASAPADPVTLVPAFIKLGQGKRQEQRNPA